MDLILIGLAIAAIVFIAYRVSRKGVSPNGASGIDDPIKPKRPIDKR